MSLSGRRTAKDGALAMRHLADEIHPEAEKIVVVQDNLNTHGIESFYAAFEAPEARRLVERFKSHCAPKHGSLLNIAAIEIAALARICLKERIATVEKLAAETAAYHGKAKPINWQFATADARTKLRSLYPSI